MQDFNPYRPPQSQVSDPAPAYALLPSARAVPMANALAWFQAGLRLILRAPSKWIAIGALYFLVFIALEVVPVIGATMRHVLAVVIEGGILLACRRAESALPLVRDMWSGFRQAFQPLLMLGLVSIVTLIAAAIAATTLEGEAGLRRVIFGEYAALETQGTPAPPDLGTLMIINIASMLVGLPLVFATALIVFHGLSTFAAVKQSARAMLLNLPALLTASAINVVLIGLALVSFGFLLIPLVPWMIATAYAAYKDVFHT